MGSESKGRAWFGKICNKLETILVEVDTFASQSTLCLQSNDPSEWESVRGEPEELAVDHSSDLQQHHDQLASVPPSHQNFDISGNVRVDEHVKEDRKMENLSAISSLSDEETLSVAAPLLHEHCDGNLTSGSTHGGEKPITTDEESQISNTLTLIPTDTKIPDAPVQDNVANMRISNEDNPDDVINGKSDVAPLDTKALSSMAFGEDPLYVDDNALYALHVRTKKLRSLKRKILDALNTKRRREEEYEQLAIWFGDADMGSDLASEDPEHEEGAIDSQVLKSEDSQWELL